MEDNSNPNTTGKVEVIGEITEIVGVILIYSDGDPSRAREAKIGDKVLSTDVINAKGGSYKIKAAEKNIEFLHNKEQTEVVEVEKETSKKTVLEKELEEDLAKLKDKAQLETKGEEKAEKSKAEEEKEKLESEAKGTGKEIEQDTSKEPLTVDKLEQSETDIKLKQTEELKKELKEDKVEEGKTELSTEPKAISDDEVKLESQETRVEPKLTPQEGAKAEITEATSIEPQQKETKIEPSEAIEAESQSEIKEQIKTEEVNPEATKSEVSVEPQTVTQDKASIEPQTIPQSKVIEHNNGGGKSLDVRSGINIIDKIDSSVLGVDGAAIGSDQFGSIALSSDEHAVLQNLRSGGSSLGFIEFAEAGVNDLGGDVTEDLFARFGITTEDPGWVINLINEYNDTVGKVPAPELAKVFFKELVASRLDFDLETVSQSLNKVTDYKESSDVLSEFDSLSSYNYAIKVDLNSAITQLNADAADQDLVITLPKEASILLMPSVGVMPENDEENNKNFVSTDNGDGTLSYSINKSVLAEYQAKAEVKLEEVNSSLEPLLTTNILLTGLKAGMPELTNINFLQQQINDIQNNLENKVLDMQKVAGVKAEAQVEVLKGAYKDLLALREEFIQQDNSLEARVTKNIDSIIVSNELEFHRLTSASNALNLAVNENNLVIYTNTDADINYQADLVSAGVKTATYAGTVLVDAEADGLEFSQDNAPTGEITVKLEHEVDMGDQSNPADASRDMVKLVVNIDVQFVDQSDSEKHEINVQLPTELQELMPKIEFAVDNPAGWEIVDGKLHRSPVIGQESLHETVVLNVLRSDFLTIKEDELNFNVDIVSKESSDLLAGDADQADNDTSAYSTSRVNETLNDFLFVKELDDLNQDGDVEANYAAALDQLTNSRQVASINIETFITELQARVEFLRSIFDPAEEVNSLQAAINLLFVESELKVALTDENARVISEVTEAGFTKDQDGNWVLTGKSLNNFFDKWEQGEADPTNAVNSEIYVGHIQEHYGKDFDVQVSAQVKDRKIKFIDNDGVETEVIDKKVVVDAVADGIEEAEPLVNYDSATMQAGPDLIKPSITVNFTPKDLDSSETFLVKLEIPDVAIATEPGYLPVEVLGWTNPKLLSTEWNQEHTVDEFGKGKTIFTTEISKEFITALDGNMFNEQLTLAFDHEYLKELTKTNTSEFNAQLFLSAKEVIEDGDREFYEVDNFIDITGENGVEFTISGLPINTFYATEVQREDENLTAKETIAIEFAEAFLEPNVTETTVTKLELELNSNIADALSPDIPLDQVRVIWSDEQGNLNSVARVVTPEADNHVFALEGDGLTAWFAAGKPDLQLVTDKFVAGTYNVAAAKVHLNDDSVVDLYAEQITVKIDAAASATESAGIEINDMELLALGGTSYLKLNVKGEFLDIDSSEKHRVEILLPEGFDGKELDMNWGLYARSVEEIRAGVNQLFYTEIDSNAKLALEGTDGPRAFISEDGKSIVIENVGASIDAPIYLGFKSDILDDVTKVDPTFVVSAVSQELAGEILANDDTADNSKQVFWKEIQLTIDKHPTIEVLPQGTIKPLVILNELQELSVVYNDSSEFERLEHLSGQTVGQAVKLDFIAGFKAFVLSQIGENLESVSSNILNNTRIDFEISGPGIEGAKFFDQNGDAISSISQNADGSKTIALTGEQLLSWLGSDADFVYMQSGLYSHEDFVLNVNGYFPGATQNLAQDMQVKVNAIADGLDQSVENTVTASLLFATDKATGEGGQQVGKSILSDEGSLQIAYDLNLADITDKSQNLSVIIDLNEFLASVDSEQKNDVIEQMTLEQAGGKWYFESENTDGKINYTGRVIFDLTGEDILASSNFKGELSLKHINLDEVLREIGQDSAGLPIKVNIVSQERESIVNEGEEGISFGADNSSKISISTVNVKPRTVEVYERQGTEVKDINKFEMNLHTALQHIKELITQDDSVDSAKFEASTIKLNVQGAGNIIMLNNYGLADLEPVATNSGFEINITGENLQKLYNAWDSGQQSAKARDITPSTEFKVGFTVQPYDDEDFTLSVEAIQTVGETNEEIKYVDDFVYVKVLPVATLDPNIKFSASFEYVLNDENDVNKGYSSDVFLKVKINELDLKDIADSSEVYTLTLNVDIPNVNFTLPVDSAVRWTKTVDDNNKVVALTIADTGKNIASWLDNSDFNTINLKTNLKSLINALDSNQANSLDDLAASFTSGLTMDVNIQDIDGAVVDTAYGVNYDLDLDPAFNKLLAKIQLSENNGGGITAEDIETFFATYSSSLAININQVVEGTEMLVPELGSFNVHNDKIELSSDQLKVLFSKWFETAGNAGIENDSSKLTLGPLHAKLAEEASSLENLVTTTFGGEITIGASTFGLVETGENRLTIESVDFTQGNSVHVREFQGVNYGIDLNASLNDLLTDIKGSDVTSHVVVPITAAASEEITTYFNKNQLSLTISFANIANDTEIKLPELGYEKIYNNKLELSSEKLADMFINWFKSAGVDGAENSNGKAVLGPLTSPLTDSLSETVNLEFNGTADIASTAISLNSEYNYMLDLRRIIGDIREQLSIAEDATVNENTTISIQLGEWAKGTTYNRGEITGTINEAGNLVLGAIEVNTILNSFPQGGVFNIGPVTDKALTSFVGVQVDDNNDAEAVYFYKTNLVSDHHFIDLTRTLEAMDADLAEHLATGETLDAYFETIEVNINVIGVKSGTVLDIPGIGEKVLASNGVLTLNAEELRAMHTLWKGVEDDASLVNKDYELAKVSTISMHQAIYSDQLFSTQINFVDKAGTLHPGEQILVSVDKVATGDSYAKLITDVVYELDDPLAPDKGFDDSAIVRIKIADLEVRDLDGSEEHSFAIKLGSVLFSLIDTDPNFQIANSGVWELGENGQLQYRRPITGDPAELLDNPEFAAIDLVFDRAKLFAALEQEGVNLEDQITFVIDNQDVGTDYSVSNSTSDVVDLSFGGHVTIAENLGNGIIHDQYDNKVSIELTNALKSVDQALNDYLDENASHTVQQFFAENLLNIKLQGMEDGTELTIPGVKNPVFTSNGLLISQAMQEVKALIQEAGFDSTNGAGAYFDQNQPQKIINLEGIADGINISFSGINEVNQGVATTTLKEFSVQGGKLIISTDYLEQVYNHWLGSSASENSEEPLTFTAVPEPSGIATSDGILTLTADNLKDLYDYWVQGDNETGLDPKGDFAFDIIPKANSSNDFTVKLEFSDILENVKYETPTKFVDVYSLPTGIDENRSYFRINDTTAVANSSIDYGPEDDKIGELGHIRLEVNLVFPESDDTDREIKIEVPNNDLSFNFNELSSNWVYNPEGFIKYVGSFEKDAETGEAVINDELNLTFSTVELAKLIQQGDDEGRIISADHVLNNRFKLEVSATDRNTVTKELDTTAALAVYNIDMPVKGEGEPFNFTEARKIDYDLNVSSIFSKILDTPAGIVENSDNLKITYTPPTGITLDPDLNGSSFAIPGINEPVTFSKITEAGTESYKATITTTQFRGWFDYWNSLTGEEQIEAATVAITRQKPAWNGLTGTISAEVNYGTTDNNPENLITPVALTMPEFLPEELSYPLISDLVAMKAAAIKYSLLEAMQQIHKIMLANDGFTKDNVNETAFIIGAINAQTLENILTDGIGGVEASSLSFIFNSAKGEIKDKQEPSVIFFDPNQDEQNDAGDYVGLTDGIITAAKLRDLYLKWYEAKAANAEGEDTDPAVYIVPSLNNDIDFLIDTVLYAKDLTTDSGQVTEFVIDEAIPVIVTMKGELTGVAFATDEQTEDIGVINVEEGSFIVSSTGVNTDSGLQSDKITSRIGDNPSISDVSSSFNVNLLLRTNDPSNDITSIKFKMPFSTSEGVTINNPGWSIVKDGNEVYAVWSKPDQSIKTAVIDTTLYFKADINALGNVTSASSSMQVGYSSSAQEDLAMATDVNGDSNLNETRVYKDGIMVNVFDNLINSVNNSLNLNADTHTLDNVDTIITGANDAGLTVNPGDNTQADDIVIAGENANDIIDASGGNDIIFGKGGADTLNAGTGDDVIYVGSKTANLTRSDFYQDSARVEANRADNTSYDWNVAKDYLSLSESLGKDGLNENNKIYTEDIIKYSFKKDVDEMKYTYGQVYLKENKSDFDEENSYIAYYLTDGGWVAYDQPDNIIHPVDYDGVMKWNDWYGADGKPGGGDGYENESTGIVRSFNLSGQTWFWSYGSLFAANDPIVSGDPGVIRSTNKFVDGGILSLETDAPLDENGNVENIINQSTLYDVDPDNLNVGEYTIKRYSWDYQSDYVDASNETASGVSTVYAGAGSDRIYGGASGNAIYLSSSEFDNDGNLIRTDDGVEDIVSYTYDDVKDGSAFDIIYDFGAEDKIDLDLLFDGMFAGSTGGSTAEERFNSITKIRAESGSSDSTAIAVKDTDGSLHKVAIIHGIALENFNLDSIIVDDGNVSDFLG